MKNFVFFVQPKYKIASAIPGSGNTRNIGAVISIEQLTHGAGPFTSLGEHVFDDYWMHYLNKDMARKADTPMPYNNIASYVAYRQQQLNIAISIEEATRLDQIDTGPGKAAADEVDE